MVKPIPEGYHSVTPYIILNAAGDAIAFYKRALGAAEVMRMDDPSVSDPVIWLSTALAPADDAIPSLVPALPA